MTRTLGFVLACGVAQLASGQSILFKDDFDGNVTPVFEVDPQPGVTIPADNMPWAVNDSGAEAQWQSANNPFAAGDYYAHINDTSSSGVGTRLMTSNFAAGGDPNGLAPLITGAVTTFSFDFYEPTDLQLDDVNGLGFGYTSDNDLNGSKRLFRSFLNNGTLSPDSGVGGGPIAYDLDTVHTIWMVGNDTDTALTNYRDSETLEPDQADVWISLAGADPIYAFTVGRQNAASNPAGVGFRTFTGDIQEFYINNVLLTTGSSFDRSAFAGPCGMGDVNCDGVVDLDNDFATIRSNFRLNVGSRSLGDLTGDGLVSLLDFVEWKSTYLSEGGSLAGVKLNFLNAPEPSTAVVATIGALALACSRRQELRGEAS